MRYHETEAAFDARLDSYEGDDEEGDGRAESLQELEKGPSDHAAERGNEATSSFFLRAFAA